MLQVLTAPSNFQTKRQAGTFGLDQGAAANLLCPLSLLPYLKNSQGNLCHNVSCQCFMDYMPRLLTELMPEPERLVAFLPTDIQELFGEQAVSDLVADHANTIHSLSNICTPNNGNAPAK